MIRNSIYLDFFCKVKYSSNEIILFENNVLANSVPFSMLYYRYILERLFCLFFDILLITKLLW